MRPGTTDLNGGVVNTTGTQTYNDPVLLTANTVLASRCRGGRQHHLREHGRRALCTDGEHGRGNGVQWRGGRRGGVGEPDNRCAGRRPT